MLKNKNKKQNDKKKIVIAVLILAVLGGGSAFAYFRNREPATTDRPVGSINYDAPTEEEKKETEEFKKQQQEEAANPTAPTTSNGNANVVLTSLSTSEARGYVGGVVEEGGTCTLNLSKGGVKITFTSTGIDDVNKTTCPAITIESGKLSSGDWTVTLSYSSTTTSGVSGGQTLRVP